jgi:hypothetical protein
LNVKAIFWRSQTRPDRARRHRGGRLCRPPRHAKPYRACARRRPAVANAKIPIFVYVEIGEIWDAIGDDQYGAIVKLPTLPAPPNT